MSSTAFDVIKISDQHFELDIKPAISTSANRLYGGAGLAASILSGEQATGRPMAWMTTQFVSSAPTNGTLAIEVFNSAIGKNITHAHLHGKVSNQDVLLASGSFGRRDSNVSEQWGAFPSLPSPESCVPFFDLVSERHETINHHLDVRLDPDWVAAIGEKNQVPSGRMCLWARVPALSEITGAYLALLGDFMPLAVSPRIGCLSGGSSLDNSLRVLRLVDTEWVLIQSQIDGVHNGIGQGTAHLWSQDGVLLGVASQSFALLTFQ